MKLRPKQSLFARMIPRLMLHSEQLGYELTFGDAWAHDGHMTNSLHYSRLAVDFNLYKDGVWQKTTDAHALLGQYWESIGGAWGGRFNDGGHYSLAHGGRK